MQNVKFRRYVIPSFSLLHGWIVGGRMDGLWSHIPLLFDLFTKELQKKGSSVKGGGLLWTFAFGRGLYVKFCRIELVTYVI